jgi:hypothetical protein
MSPKLELQKGHNYIQFIKSLDQDALRRTQITRLHTSGICPGAQLDRIGIDEADVPKTILCTTTAGSIMNNYKGSSAVLPEKEMQADLECMRPRRDAERIRRRYD